MEHADTNSTAEATRGHCACVHAVVCGMKLADRAFLRNPEDAPLRNPGRLIRSPPLLFPDAVRPWMCAWPPHIAAAARGDAAQAAFDHKHSYYRNEMVELRQQGIHCRPLFRTADGPPHPTLQHAADIASTRSAAPLVISTRGLYWLTMLMACVVLVHVVI